MKCFGIAASNHRTRTVPLSEREGSPRKHLSTFTEIQVLDVRQIQWDRIYPAFSSRPYGIYGDLFGRHACFFVSLFLCVQPFALSLLPVRGSEKPPALARFRIAAQAHSSVRSTHLQYSLKVPDLLVYCTGSGLLSAYFSSEVKSSLICRSEMCTRTFPKTRKPIVPMPNTVACLCRSPDHFYRWFQASGVLRTCVRIEIHIW